ncbi:SIMPL domain-containing protein [Gaoshiqia sp. Z1-71]|uniref:SIMPL domain-containing protein n=1 Tax=Gaoshiqia hydrogeniformans TaxID=3290090 RepID=UPI003BF90C10
MRTTFFLLIIIIWACESFAQSSQKISIEGIARIKEKPELIIVSANLIVKDKSYKACFEKSLSSLTELKSVFEKNGIDPHEIESEEMNISEEYNWTGMERESVGFFSNIKFEIESVFSNEFSQNLLKSLSNEGLNLNYQIRFEFSELQKEKIRKLALEKAIEDATVKAEIIAKTANLKLNGISGIEYSSNRKNFSFLDMESDKLEVADEVIPITGVGFNFGLIDLNPKEKSISKVILIEWDYIRNE